MKIISKKLYFSKDFSNNMQNYIYIMFQSRLRRCKYVYKFSYKYILPNQKMSNVKKKINCFYIIFFFAEFSFSSHNEF